MISTLKAAFLVLALTRDDDERLEMLRLLQFATRQPI